MKIEQYSIGEENILTHVTFKPPYRANHPLNNQIRFVLVVQGKSVLHSPLGRFSLTSGDCVLMKCDNFINLWEANDDDSLSEVIIIRLVPEVLHKIYNPQFPQIFTSNEFEKKSTVVTFKTEESLKQYINSLAFYLKHPHLRSEEIFIMKLREFIYLLSKLENNQSINDVLNTLSQSQIHQFSDIIQANIFNQLSLEELAFICGLSLSSFQRKFKETFNTSPARYIREQRIERAKYLLKTSNSRISEIAYSTGFENTAHFSRTFRNSCNCSPSDFRTMNH